MLRLKEGSPGYSINRYTKDQKSREEALNAVAKEKLIQLLPSSAATYVRDKDPKTSSEAARIADLYFQDRRSSPDNPRWQETSQLQNTNKIRKMGKATSTDLQSQTGRLQV